MDESRNKRKQPERLELWKKGRKANGGLLESGMVGDGRWFEESKEVDQQEGGKVTSGGEGLTWWVSAAAKRKLW